MGLSALAFAAAAGILAVIVLLARKGQGTAAARWELAANLAFLLVATCEGIVLSTALDVRNPGAFLLAARLASAGILAATLCLVGFAVNFPRRLWRHAWILPAALAPALAFALYLVFGTQLYIAKASYAGSGFALVAGPAFDWVNLGSLLAGLGAAGIHLTRGLQTSDRINRQRSRLAFVGVVIGVAAVWTYQFVGIRRPESGWSSVAIPYMALAMGGVSAYAMSVSRLFDWREFFRSLLSYVMIALVVGVPAGGAILLFSLLGSQSALVLAAGGFLTFVVASQVARGFRKRYFERAGAHLGYRETLESALAHVDLSEGRDAVISELQSLLAESLGFTDFTILIEDDRGALKTAHSSANAHATLDKSDALRSLIEKEDVNVLMLSEAQAESRWEASQAELLALFDALKAEVLIFAREGRRIIGVFAIGARKIGGEYTDYDYDTFQAIYAKLFVFAFYLKNVARESILYTVDRELALSDQVIRFALEHVAPVSHPKADAAWAMRSTRSLGGDFVDFVKMGQGRYFFVLGDVSGKGLSASMNMLILKSMVRTFLRIEKDFTGLVQRVNLFIKEHLPRGSFFAGVFGYFDFERNILYFINCGIPAMMLYSPSFDAFIEIQGDGKVLGFVRDVKPYLKPRKIALTPGTALVVCTDGLLDSENIRGERFGKERLRKSSRDRLKESARQMADGVLEDLLGFTGNRQEDDITLLAMKIRQPGETS